MTRPEHGSLNQPSAAWTSEAGDTWRRLQHVLDAAFKDVEQMLCDAISPLGAEAVLDVGCGAGATTYAIASTLGPNATCTGIDISEQLVTAAQSSPLRSDRRARFICGDAATYPLPPSTFDAIASRFGLMFFTDPTAAFRQLRRACKPGAALTGVVWRSPAENPFITAPARAAQPWIPPPAQPAATNAPGQFGLADRAYAASHLSSAGWNDVAFEPVEFQCSIPIADLDAYLASMGPVGRAFPPLSAADAAAARSAVRAALEPFCDDRSATFQAACWVIRARA